MKTIELSASEAALLLKVALTDAAISADHKLMSKLRKLAGILKYYNANKQEPDEGWNGKLS